MKIYHYDNNKPIIVSDNTLKLTPHTWLTNGEIWEFDSLTYFYNLIDDSGNYNILDIGCQTGLYSLYAKYRPNCKFYAFDPFEKSIKCLQENLDLNQIKNVLTLNYALSDIEGETILNTCKSHNGLHTIGTPLRFNDVNQITIKTKTIDNMFYNQNIPVHFIKIDTEGFEYYILKGGIKTIKKYKPIIQLEWNKDNMKQCNVSEPLLNEMINELLYEKMIIINEELFIKPKNI
jgi:FkbM family methyltransferase